MKQIYPRDSSTSLDKLLTTVSRLMTHYARSPDARVATSIALCFERLAAVAAEDWPLLSRTGRHLSEAWRTALIGAASVSPEEVSDGCHRLTLAEGEHCKLTCCTECGAVFAHFGSFRLRLPQAVFRSICDTFVQAEKRLRLPSAHPPVSGGARRGERNRAMH